MRQGFGFDVFGKLCGVGVEGVDMRVKLIKRTENTEKELGMGGDREWRMNSTAETIGGEGVGGV